LLKALDIRIGQARTFVLNMVGAFYNTFMPGSTGGDLLKAYYVAKHTTHRTRAVISVIVDRIIGLIALIIVGGVASAYQYAFGPANDPSRHACMRVAITSAAILIVVSVGLYIFFHPSLRKWSGLDWFLKKLPLQTQVQKAVEALHIYSRRPLLVLGAIVVTFPVHITVIISAMLAGMAFDLHIRPTYYWVAVPVIVLVGAIPISPQGAGVMEAMAFVLTRSQGASANEAVALTMSIRVVQVLWNLVGGLFVLRGGYHAPTVAEQHELEVDEEKLAAAPVPTRG
jgi:uncharacterized protein (TIRG00374 family)